MEQFLTGDIWEEVNRLSTSRQKKIACIAYVTTNKLKLAKGDILICDASKFSIKFGETSARILKWYYEKGVEIYSNRQLHAKILITDSFLVTGSANLSKNSAENLIESSIITDSDVLKSQAKAFCYNLLKESTLLTGKEINSLLKIDIVKRPQKLTGKSNIRKKKFGNQYWYVSTHPIKDSMYEKVKHTVEKTTTIVSRSTNIEEDDISFLILKSKTKFTNTAKEGDQIILRVFNSEKTRSFIYPPSSILKKELVDGVTYFFLDDRGLEEKKVSWVKFQSFLKDHTLEKNFANRSIIISENDIQKLNKIWNS